MGLENLRPIYEQKTKYQTIRFYENTKKELLLTLDTFIQFVEGEDETIYHDVLTRPAFEMNPKAKNILILGGGDGLVARNVKKLNPESNITLVDLDEELVELFKTKKRLVKLNEGSLLKDINIVIADALIWIKDNQDKKFDIIILDFPDANNHELKKLYKKEFIAEICNLLDKNGVIAIQCHFNISDIEAGIIQDILGNNKQISYTMPYLDGGKIVLGQLNGEINL